MMFSVMPSGTVGRGTTATFRLFGDATLTAAAVTQRLGIQPTRAMEAGDRMSSRSAATRDSSAWLLSSSPGIETGTELAEQLHRLLVLLEPGTYNNPEVVGYDSSTGMIQGRATVSGTPASRVSEGPWCLGRPTMVRFWDSQL